MRHLSSWLREIAGWALVLVGLYIVRICVLFVMDLESPRIIEASVLGFIALGVLRAGVLLIRISAATRIASS